MDDSRERPAVIAILAATLFAASFFLPWFDIRANRVAAAALHYLPGLGARAWPLALMPVILLPLQFQRRRAELQDRGIRIMAFLTLVLPLLAIPGMAREYAGELGEFGRLGLNFGWYLYILAGLVQIIPSRRPRGAMPAVLVGLLIGLGLLWYLGGWQTLGVIREAVNQRRRLLSELLMHIRITLLSVGISTLIGLPLAVAAYRYKWFRRRAFPLLNILQTIPSIALFGLMIAPLAALSRAVPALRAIGVRGIGNAPAIIALSIYGLYPVIRNSYTALALVDRKVVEAGQGMGMSPAQLWRIIRLPLAAPVILHGIRLAAIQTLGNATLAKLIGGNGLGVFVFEGLGQASVDMVLLGMSLIILLTLVTDQLLQAGVYIITPRALRRQYAIS